MQIMNTMIVLNRKVMKLNKVKNNKKKQQIINIQILTLILNLQENKNLNKIQRNDYDD